MQRKAYLTRRSTVPGTYVRCNYTAAISRLKIERKTIEVPSTLELVSVTSDLGVAFGAAKCLGKPRPLFRPKPAPWLLLSCCLRLSGKSRGWSRAKIRQLRPRVLSGLFGQDGVTVGGEF